MCSPKYYHVSSYYHNMCRYINVSHYHYIICMLPSLIGTNNELLTPPPPEAEHLFGVDSVTMGCSFMNENYSYVPHVQPNERQPIDRMYMTQTESPLPHIATSSPSSKYWHRYVSNI